MDDTNKAFQRCVETMEMNRLLEQEELKRLSQKPGILNAAQALTDRLLAELNYFCNYTKIVTESGKEFPIIEVIQQIQDGVKETFEKLTGQCYRPPIVRNHDFRYGLERLREAIEEKGNSNERREL